MSKDGGQAFPRTTTMNAPGQPWNEEQTGMTLRDWFAGQALVGIAPKLADAMQPNNKLAAKHAYEVADAMLKERERQ